ncbi:MAG: IS110 family transposase [Planctomycetia bacterium]|nr:IS110 family transposase [Planctomycetia bacterium]
MLKQKAMKDSPFASLAQRTHAAGIDVGDTTHWVCVNAEGGDAAIREFPAHTPGLQNLVTWLRECAITTVALEATGAYGHVLFLSLLEAGFHVITTSPTFTRQIKGRPKTDRRDCQWIQRLHRHGLLPSIFQPDEATQTLRDLVRQRANHVRLSAQHIQRLQKALGLMNLKLTSVLGDVTGVTGLKIIRAIVAGERDPRALAKLRDQRCQHSAEEIAIALTGRYRLEHVTELSLCLKMWDHYQEVIAELDEAIARQLRTMKKQTVLPPLPPKSRMRGRKAHDPRFDVRQALYLMVGIDLTAIEGIDEMHALTLISELGCEFTKWKTVKHFTSWLGLCPNWKKTGGQVQSSQTRKGKNRAALALRLAAWSLVRSKSYLGAYLRRQRSRLGAPKAITATAHKLARIIYHLMRHGFAYMKKEETAYAEQVRHRLEKQLHRRARELGYELKKVEPLGEVVTSEGEIITV